MSARRERFAGPVTAEHTAAGVDEAIASLRAVRELEWVGDAGDVVPVVASLLAELERRLPQVVADARDQELSVGADR